MEPTQAVWKKWPVGCAYSIGADGLRLLKLDFGIHVIVKWTLMKAPQNPMI